MAYKQRVADALLERKLQGKGAVLIEGPKWCGKTTTAKQIAKSVLDLGDSDVFNQSERMIALSASTLLEGATPRLIDEWQTLPALWDSIRTAVDKRSEFAQFILSVCVPCHYGSQERVTDVSVCPPCSMVSR